MPVELVYFTYFLAISYVLADTVVRVRATRWLGLVRVRGLGRHGGYTCSPTRWLGLGVGVGLALALPLALVGRKEGGRVLLTLPLALARWTRAGRVPRLRGRTRSSAPPSVLSLTLT